MRISDWSSDVCSSDLKAEHILCSPDRQATFKSIYAGERPAVLHKCRAGAEKVARDAETVRKMGVSGTPTLFVDGKLVSGFQQAELEAFIEASTKIGRAHAVTPVTNAPLVCRLLLATKKQQ